METTTDPKKDPLVLAKFELHKAKKAKLGKVPLTFEAWLQFFQFGQNNKPTRKTK